MTLMIEQYSLFGHAGLSKRSGREGQDLTAAAMRLRGLEFSKSLYGGNPVCPLDKAKQAARRHRGAKDAHAITLIVPADDNFADRANRTDRVQGLVGEHDDPFVFTLLVVEDNLYVTDRSNETANFFFESREQH